MTHQLRNTALDPCCSGIRPMHEEEKNRNLEDVSALFGFSPPALLTHFPLYRALWKLLLKCCCFPVFISSHLSHFYSLYFKWLISETKGWNCCCLEVPCVDQCFPAGGSWPSSGSHSCFDWAAALLAVYAFYSCIYFDFKIFTVQYVFRACTLGIYLAGLTIQYNNFNNLFTTRFSGINLSHDFMMGEKMCALRL